MSRSRAVQLSATVPPVADIQLLRAEFESEADAPLVIIRYARNREEQAYGLRFDLAKMVFLDTVGDSELDSKLASLAPTLARLIADRPMIRLSYSRDIDLQAGFKDEGVFWLPGHDEGAVEGTLSYDPSEGLELRISRGLPGAGDPFSSGKYSTIHGNLVGGTGVTLLDAFVRSQVFGTGASGTTTIFANRAIYGLHLPSDASIRFDRIRVRFTSLETWLRVSPFQIEWGSSEPFGALVKYTPPPPLVLDLPQHHPQISAITTLSQTQDMTSMRLQFRAAFEADCRTQQSLEECLSLSGKLQNLMTLLIGDPVAVRELAIRPADIGTGGPEEFCRLVFLQRATAAKADIHPAEMLMAQERLGDLTYTAFSRWFEGLEHIETSMAEFFGDTYDPAPTLESRFLAVAYAIDGYERAKSSATYMSPHDYTEIRRAIQAAVLPGATVPLKRRLDRLLTKANELSFADRLRSARGRLPVKLASSISGADPLFEQRLEATREHLIGDAPLGEAAPYAGIELYHAIQKMRILMFAVLLIDLGIPPDTVAASISSKDWMNWELREKRGEAKGSHGD